MCSGSGSNFENVVRTCVHDEVVIMIHNKKHCGAMKRANKLGIPHCHIKSKDEDQIITMFKAWRVELIVMAGWMRIVTNELIQAFPDRIINVHPSLLPKYKGLHAVERAFESGDTVTGATVHYVTEELDSGAIIEQGEVPIHSNDTIDTLTRRIHLQEYAILPTAIENVKHQLQKSNSRYLLSHDLN